MGAADPTSGTVSVHEIVRGFGELLKQGWKPLRTIVLASWDAEEVCLPCLLGNNCRSEDPQYGLIGSSEYGEDFADWLKEHVVAYLNLGKRKIVLAFQMC
jgi:N-acetylated-alpha-linked acidic dipeptidase